MAKTALVALADGCVAPKLLLVIIVQVLLIGCHSQSSCANISCSGDAGTIHSNGSCVFCESCFCTNNRRHRWCSCQCEPEDLCTDDDDDEDSVSTAESVTAIVAIVSVVMACLCVVCLCVGSTIYWARRKTSYYPLDPEDSSWDSKASYIPPQATVSAAPLKNTRSPKHQTATMKASKSAESRKKQKHYVQKQPVPSAPPEDLGAAEPSAPPLEEGDDGHAVTGKLSIYE